MTVKEAKETVVMAGKRLVSSGLIARTWGNVSCRISSSHFVITPSGRDYLSLTPEEIVEVAVSDCSYSGSIKPSSEKGIHVEVYKLHPEINFVIHTHQHFASAVSALCLNSIQVDKKYETLQNNVICADYGLPGTKKLREGVAKALAKTKGSAVIMKNHGALVFGDDFETAFKAAQELEAACEQFVHDQYIRISGSAVVAPELICNYAISYFTGNVIDLKGNNFTIPYESERKNEGFRIFYGDISHDVLFDHFDKLPATDPFLINEARLHNEIYKKYKDTQSILHSNTSAITAISCAEIKIKPLLDDFAQIAGTSISTVSPDISNITSKLKHTSLIFLKNNGALSLGNTKRDAHAVSIVAEKNSNAMISAALFNKVKYINPFECIIMRFVYLKKYSKQVYKK